MEEKLRFVLEYGTGMEHDGAVRALRGRTGNRLCVARGAIGRAGWQGVARARVEPRCGIPIRRRPRSSRRCWSCGRRTCSWGPRKLKRVLERDQPGQRVAGGEHDRRAAGAGRAGGCATQAAARTPPYTEPLAHADGPNRVWCADFKGWFRTGDGERIDPLTITDACSRYLLRCQRVQKTDYDTVRAIFRSRRFASADCRGRSAPITARRLRRERWRDFRGWRCGG